jgi:serine/threonine-protein phosphatase 2A regulatory subunit B
LHLAFEEEEDPTNRSFFSEIISSISDVKFSHDGRYILSRDYLSLKIWDVNMDARPVKTIPIHDHLRGKLCDLYENDCIFDKFECVWGGDDKWAIVYWSISKTPPLTSNNRHVLTGSYHNYFRIYDTDTLSDVVLQADKSAFKAKKIGGPLAGNKPGQKNGRPLREAMLSDTLDFNKKILHASWHPRENTIAVCSRDHRSRRDRSWERHRSQQRITYSCTVPHDYRLRAARSFSPLQTNDLDVRTGLR